jgi:hypothetical protein
VLAVAAPVEVGPVEVGAAGAEPDVPDEQEATTATAAMAHASRLQHRTTVARAGIEVVMA